ncbi:hypothetical protein I302_101289 [Kwoniella bestiolae CBS 10118]|uniref:SMP-30/Gluconolactonase/LRE-like region domain-containing protein n=1 Tax=Kwoniella bestiolae CBS 10118 TaxID=1296100 RepID=A0A1B9G7J5_9TREE|nr:hypothetical protein I302_04663 [Kwoniella bestiolae CBS 10118]OCF26971.1 hypothetical protein I302_04663 [Kwoniella bestiolae CBS 10118]
MASHTIPIFDAEVLVKCQNNLGEGVVWDSKTQLLHWVDIFAAQLHTLNPSTGAHSVDKYPSKCLTYITPRTSQPGFIGATEGALVILPEATTPTEVTPTPKINDKRPLKVLSEPLKAELVKDETIRFNDGGVDSKGRVFIGSMGQDESAEVYPGELWRYDLDGTQTKILDQVGVSNGIGFSPDGKLMYYIDSRKDQIEIFNYDPSTGTPSDRRKFVSSPPALDDAHPTEGVYDGLCMDGVGNVWAARWRNGRVIGINPKGEIIAMIRVRGSRGATIPCFGGPNLETMYITTAASHMGGPGDQAKYPNSGDLYSIDFGPESPIRKVLGEGWKGAERHRASI